MDNTYVALLLIAGNYGIWKTRSEKINTLVAFVLCCY